MCSQSGPDYLDRRRPNFKYLKDEPKSVQCKKCANKAFVLIQRKDALCQDCLLNYCSHKFRSTIGKSRFVKPGYRVLVAYSGGLSSSALIDLIKEGLNADQHRKLLFIPSILYVDEGCTFNETPDERRERCKEIEDELIKIGWDSFVTSLGMSYRQTEDQKEEPQFYHKLSSDQSVDQLKMFYEENESRFRSVLSSIKSLSAKGELIKQMRLRLICDIAKKEGFNVIFVGSNASLLATDLISNVALGKGIQLQSEVAFIDTRYQIPILKPMREFVVKEIAFYNVMKKVRYFTNISMTHKLSSNSSIEKLSESFVTELQDEFPATVYTIFKTGNKLEAFDGNNSERCVLCNIPIDVINRPKCSAFQALKITNKLSNNESIDTLDTSLSAPTMCYSCQRIANELDSSQSQFLPRYFYKRTDKKDIEQFLISDND